MEKSYREVRNIVTSVNKVFYKIECIVKNKESDSRVMPESNIDTGE